MVDQIQVCLQIVFNCLLFCSNSRMQIHQPVVQVVYLVVGFPFLLLVNLFTSFYEAFGVFVVFLNLMGYALLLVILQ